MDVLSQAGVVETLERARAMNWPAMPIGLTGATTEAGEVAWSHALRSWSRPQAIEAAAFLGKLEAAAELEASQARERARQAAGEPDDVRELREAEQLDAERALREYEAGRPKRIEALLSRIAATLDELVKR
jgi:hypothetical protein